MMNVRSILRSIAIARYFVFAIFSLVSSFAYGEHALGDYEIAPRDLVEFQIYEEPDTRIVQRVSASGELPFPFIGVVKVAGLSLREAEKKLSTLYIDQEFFVNPQVILVLDQYAERSVSVLGQVNRPEQILFPLEADSISIVHAITMAGGLTRLAKADSIQVTRIGDNGKEQRIVVDVGEHLAARRRGNESENFYLMPGDVIFVPERSF